MTFHPERTIPIPTPAQNAPTSTMLHLMADHLDLILPLASCTAFLSLSLDRTFSVPGVEPGQASVFLFSDGDSDDIDIEEAV